MAAEPKVDRPDDSAYDAPRESSGTLRLISVAVMCLAIGGGIGAFVMWNQSGKLPNAANTKLNAVTPGELEIVAMGRVSAPGPEIPLQSKVPGQVKTVRVKEGELVTGLSTVLFELDDRPYRLKADGLQAAVEGARAALKDAETERDKLPIYKARLQLAHQNAVLQTSAAREALRSMQETQTKNPKMDLDGEIKQAEIKINQAQLMETDQLKQLELLDQTDVKSKIDQASANLRQVNLEHQAALDAIADCQVKAPADGVVLKLFAGVGSQAAPGSPMALAMVAPAGKLIIKAELDQEYLGKVVAGQTCKFKDETRTDSTIWTGQVLFVKKYVAKPTSILLEPGEINDVRTVEVVVEPMSSVSKDELVIGQRVRVRFGKIE